MSRTLVAIALAAWCGVAAAAAQPAGVDPPAQRCGGPDRKAEVVTLKTRDGVVLDGAVVGSGPRGVVLVHELGRVALCGWWPYAARLADRGFRVLLYDSRCAGLSDCPAYGHDALVEDVAAAVAELRRRRVRSVEIVGASYGAATALVAATRIRGVAAVAGLSGELTSEIRGLGGPVSPIRAARRLRVPLLVAVAQRDPYVTVAESRTLFRRAAARDKRLVLLPSEAGHGWQLLDRPAGSGWSPFERQLTAFLVRNAA